MSERSGQEPRVECKRLSFPDVDFVEMVMGGIKQVVEFVRDDHAWDCQNSRSGLSAPVVSNFFGRMWRWLRPPILGEHPCWQMFYQPRVELDSEDNVFERNRRVDVNEGFQCSQGLRGAGIDYSRPF